MLCRGTHLHMFEYQCNSRSGVWTGSRGCYVLIECNGQRSVVIVCPYGQVVVDALRSAGLLPSPVTALAGPSVSEPGTGFRAAQGAPSFAAANAALDPAYPEPNPTLQHARWRFVVVVGLVVAPFFPAANVLFPVGTFIGERLLYAPSVGFCLLAADALARLAGQHLPRLLLLRALSTPDGEHYLDFPPSKFRSRLGCVKGAAAVRSRKGFAC